MGKRANGERSVYQRKAGTWCAAIVCDDPATGRRTRTVSYGKTRIGEQQLPIHALAGRLLRCARNPADDPGDHAEPHRPPRHDLESCVLDDRHECLGGAEGARGLGKCVVQSRAPAQERSDLRDDVEEVGRGKRGDERGARHNSTITSRPPGNRSPHGGAALSLAHRDYPSL